jgi:hypothetical protein
VPVQARLGDTAVVQRRQPRLSARTQFVEVAELD